MLLNAGAERVSFHPGERVGACAGTDAGRHLTRRVRSLHEHNFTGRSSIRLTDSTPGQRQGTHPCEYSARPG
jgi:hypothetical protein